MDLITLTLAKNYAKNVLAGFTSMVADNANHKLVFTTNNGQTAEIDIPVQKVSATQTEDTYKITIE